MEEFTIIPILGRKSSVPQNDPSLFQFIKEGVALTYDVGGVNFDLARKKNACSKAYGYSEWSNSANAQATKCLGLFELWDGTNRDHIFFDNGKCYIYDSALDPIVKEDAGSTTFATDNVDLYSIIQVGSYMVFTDRGEHTPYKWKNGDANLTKLIASGTEYKFRYLVSFQRRILGLYSDQTDGDIDVRWSTDWPATAITSLNFPAANQLYVPNDDSLVGGATMGANRCFLVCENSIQECVYYPDYTSPFRLYTIIPHQGGVNHHSIVSLGDRILLFNRNYGFCEYRGGNQFPYGGRPISDDIESDLLDINTDYYDLIVGVFVPLTREVVWTVPGGGNSTPDQLWFYNIDTKQWRFEDKIMRYVASWRMYENYTWNDLITDLGGTGAVWTTAGVTTWAYYMAMRDRLVYANTDGKLYYHISEALDGSDLDGYRIEPILDFGDSKRKDLLKEIWFDLGLSGNYSIDIYHRGGNTVGEVLAASWTALQSLSHNSPERPVIYPAKSARLHQIKWGTNLKDEKFEVSSITFKYEPQSDA